MGIVDNIKKRMGGAEDAYDDAYNDDGYYSESFGSYEEPEEMTAPADTMGSASVSTGAGTGLSGMSMGGGISLSGNGGSALEMKVVKPESFDSVAQIADHLLSRRTVVLNLESTNKETARRLIDFLSGVAYSIDGSLKKIATNAYVITPNNVDVGDAKLTRRGAQTQSAPQENTSDEFGEY
ncbi:MAG: cell division protein SepF [Clostridiales bacterium]|jgi:cell division inhibitor SepF|nr:cell division protein SepF [Clostridiales bacterium]